MNARRGTVNGPAISVIVGPHDAGKRQSFSHLLSHLLRIAAFIGIAIIFYSPWLGANEPVGGWDENRTSESWDTFMWNWDAADAFYFAMVTMTTVGYGDMPTLSQRMRVFTLFFGSIGVVFVAASINVIADWFAEQGRRKFIKRQRVLLREAHVVAERVRNGDMLGGAPGSERDSLRKSKDLDEAEGKDLGEAEGKVLGEAEGKSEPETVAAQAVLVGSKLPPIENPPSASDGSNGGANGLPHQPAWNTPPAVASPPAMASPPPSPPVAPHPQDGYERGAPPPGKGGEGSSNTSNSSSSSGEGAKGSEAARKLTPSCQFDPGMVLRVLKALRLTGFFILLCILLGEIENHQLCGFFGAGWRCGGPNSCDAWKLSPDGNSDCWSWIDELYYAVITFVTIGFGDVSPKTKGGKILGAFIVTLGVFCFTTLLAELAEIRHAKRLGAEKTLRQRLEELMEVVEKDDDGKVSPEEYIIFNLKKMGKVDDETLALLKDQFKALDADGSGELDADDIHMLTKACDALDAAGAGANAAAPLSNVQVAPAPDP